MANVSSTSIMRNWSSPRPAIRIALVTDEWAWVDVYATRRLRSPAAPTRARAASRAHSVASDALCWMTPPPGPSDLNRSGRPNNSTSQSSTWVSSSVQAGLVAHSMPCTPRPAESSSPRIDGPEALAGK